MKSNRLFFSLAIMLIFILPSALFAQWSSDPTANTIVSNLTGDQAVPKLAAAANGDTYMGWMSNATGNYNVRLQRYNAAGERQWEQNGILISDYPQESWITDWDMQTDNAGNALLTFNDSRNGNWDVFAYKISPAGEFLWGEAGIELSTATTMDVAPKIIATENNQVVVAWSSADGTTISLQRISATGELLWDETYLIEGENSYTWPQLLATSDDGVIVKYFEDSGPGWSPTRHVFARKLSGSGTAVWTEDATISTAGGISAWTQIFSLISDGADGFFIAWHEDRDNDMNANIYLQHILADGSAQYSNGLEIAVAPSFENYYPKIARAQSGDLYASWVKMDADQNQRGIGVQRISEEGERLWGPAGMVTLSLSNNDPMSALTTVIDDQMLALYSNQTTINAFRLDQNGDFVWAAQTVELSTNSVSAGDLEAVQLADDQIVAFWREDSGLWAQNINPDGSLGALEFVPETPQNLSVDQFSGLVSWDAPANDLPAAYNLYLDEEFLINLDSETFQYQLTDLSFGTEYTVGLNADYETETSELLEYSFIYSGSSAAAELDLHLNLQNYPNPFNPATSQRTSSTTISFNLPEASFVELEIYNIRGQKIRSLNSSELAAGRQKFAWDGKDSSGNSLAAGIYYYRLQAADFQQTNKMLLLK
ncbi:MAG: FlgD immunoglobulin-like domain containing protein [Candidatus Cloacimonadales bacterium]